ncbi:MAG: hypothetical protein IJV40_12215 [Oscillospiraceae bacterium]|nr:hypothetical protein [Oscillospiraceae bacterium]
MYATFEDYTGRFRGRAVPDEETFDRLAVRADAVLDRLTLGRAAKYRDTAGKLALACCAVTEKLYELEEAKACGDAAGKIAAEEIGDHRVQYRRLRTEDCMTELAALAEMYLYGTGLLYRGIPVVTGCGW